MRRGSIAFLSHLQEIVQRIGAVGGLVHEVATGIRLPNIHQSAQGVGNGHPLLACLIGYGCGQAKNASGLSAVAGLNVVGPAAAVGRDFQDHTAQGVVLVLRGPVGRVRSGAIRIRSRCLSTKQIISGVGVDDAFGIGRKLCLLYSPQAIRIARANDVVRGILLFGGGDADCAGRIGVAVAGLTAIGMRDRERAHHQIVRVRHAGARRKNVVFVARGLLLSGAGIVAHLRTVVNRGALGVGGIRRAGLCEIRLRIRADPTGRARPGIRVAEICSMSAGIGRGQHVSKIIECIVRVQPSVRRIKPRTRLRWVATRLGAQRDVAWNTGYTWYGVLVIVRLDVREPASGPTCMDHLLGALCVVL